MIEKAQVEQTLQDLLSQTRQWIKEEHNQLRQAKDTFTELKQSISDIDEKLYQVENKLQKFSLIRIIPVLGSASKKRILTDKHSLLGEKKKYLSEVKQLRSEADIRLKRIETLKSLGLRLSQKAKEFSRIERPSFDISFTENMETIINKVEFSKKSKTKRSNDEFNELLIGSIRVLQSWITRVETAEQESKKHTTSVTETEKDTGKEVKTKIYLPIPVSLRFHAQKLGAHYDENAGRGSRMYVDLDNPEVMKKRDIQNLLPLAYRQEKEKLEFPPIRYTARRQNLWTMFSKDTWNFIRSTNYDRVGVRCMVCGNRGGKLLEHIFDDNKNKKDSVECHEVWEWEVPDPNSGIGIQRLKEILVVCVDCHMMFHESYAVSVAEKKGLSDETEAFLKKRMMLVNGTGLDELNADIEHQKSLSEQHRKVEKWIIDLTHLSEQEYMSNYRPVFREDNEAGVLPEEIAGLEFETESGIIYESIDAEELYAKLISDIERTLETNLGDQPEFDLFPAPSEPVPERKITLKF